jgi:hypothetical protein
MSETEVHQDLAAASAKPKSPLMSFAIKVAIIAFAVLLVVHLTVSIVAEEIANTALLKGGPQFWSSVEQSLYKFADAPDLPPEKKEKIVKALAKIYAKYQPYVDALNGRVSK